MAGAAGCRRPHGDGVPAPALWRVACWATVAAQRVSCWRLCARRSVRCGGDGLATTAPKTLPATLKQELKEDGIEILYRGTARTLNREHMGKARFSPAIGQVKWHAGGDCIVGIERVEVIWVQASSEYEIRRDWPEAANIRLRWYKQVELREAHKQIGLWTAKRQEAEKAIQDWTVRAMEIEAKLLSDTMQKEI